MIKDLITDTYYWFVDLVAERRQMSRDDALLLSDGRVFSGDRGLKNKLVDALGGETAAKDWLVSEKGLDKDLKVNDWKPFDPNQSYLNLQAVKQWLFEGDASSLKGVNPENLPAIVPKRLFLDGLLSIWHK